MKHRNSMGEPYAMYIQYHWWVKRARALIRLRETPARDWGQVHVNRRMSSLVKGLQMLSLICRFRPQHAVQVCFQIPSFFPPGVLHHCIRKEKNQNKTQICQVKHLKSFHEWIIGGGVSVFKVWQQPKKRKKKEGCCDSDKLQETEATWTTNEILIFTTDRAATICLISPKIKNKSCAAFHFVCSVQFRPVSSAPPRWLTFSSCHNYCLSLAGKSHTQEDGQTTMSNHGANNNENRKHVLNRCQGFVFISNRIWRGGRKWQHRSSHFVINPCPEFRKYLQSVTCVCLRKMMLLQQPQQSLPDHWADSNRSPWLRCNETLWLWKEGDDAKPGGEKKGEKKSRGRVGRWRQIQVWVRIPWIVLFMSASLFNENQKDFSWGNIQQNGVRNEWAEGGEKKFVIFIFIFFMSTVWACCRQALKNWADRFLWEKKTKKFHWSCVLLPDF